MIIINQATPFFFMAAASIEYCCTRLPQKEWPRSNASTTPCRGDKRRLELTLKACAKHGECPFFVVNPMLS